MKAIMRDEQEMRDSGIEWASKMPNHWVNIPLYSVLEEINQKNEPVITTNILSLTNMAGVIPYSERGNQGNKAKTILEDYKVVYPNTIVANSMNILIGSVGLSKYEGCVSPVYYVYKSKNETDIRYINYLFQMESFQKNLRKYANGILEIRLRVSSHDILHQKIACPSYKEQQSIANYLDDRCSKIDAIIAEAKASIEEYKELKQAVIYEAVTKGLDKNAEMMDSGVELVGKIPKNWTLKRFKYVARIKSNLVSPDEYMDYYQIAPDCIEKDSGIISINRLVKDAGVISGNHLFYKGQILYSKIRPILNKVAIAPYDGLCSADMYPLDTIEDTDFVAISMQAKYFVSQVELITRDRVKMPKINQEELGNIFMPIPPRDIQYKIVKYVNNKNK